MSATSILGEIKGILENVEADAVKFDEKGVDAAGMRVRKALLEMTKKANAGRKTIQEIRSEKKNN